MRIAIIGAGIAGLTCARALAEAGIAPVVFDKARGPGGRMATRRRAMGAFDHGAQYFTIKDDAFGAVVRGWATTGVVAPWRARFGRVAGKKGRFVAEAPARTRWVGTPRMSALTRHLSSRLDLRVGTRIEKVVAGADGWTLVTTDGLDAGVFDRVVVATPAPQAVPLLAGAPAIAARAAAAEMAPSWAAMVRLARPALVDFDAADVQVGPVAWAARNDSKPGRGDTPCWVLHARAGWAAEHIEDDFDAVAAALVKAFAVHVPDFEPAEAVAHRWRYALVTAAAGPAAHLDPSGLGACGDWCVGARVESAWQSGRAMAEAILKAG